MEIKITFTAWRETINRFQKIIMGHGESFFFDHPLLVVPYNYPAKTTEQVFFACCFAAALNIDQAKKNRLVLRATFNSNEMEAVFLIVS